MNIADPQSGRGVQNTVHAGQNGRCNRRRESPRQPEREYLSYDQTKGRIAHVTEQLVRDDPGNHDEWRDDHQPNRCCCEYAFLAFFNGRRRHRALGNRLVGAPVKYLNKDHAGKQRVPRDRRRTVAYHCQTIRRDTGKIKINGRQ